MYGKSSPFFILDVCLWCSNIEGNKYIFLRYEVKFQQAMECGGAYVKLLSKHDALQLVSVFNLQL